jgi:type I restriction enzyme M protein
MRDDTEMRKAKAWVRPDVVGLLHALRGGGLPNPMAALEQLSFLLLLLYLNPHSHHWSELVTCPGESRVELLRGRLFPDVIRRPRVGGPALEEAMRDATFAFPSPELLDLVVQRLDALPPGEFMCADLLDAALDEVSATSSVGSPRTPPSVSACMIALTVPRTGELVIDPAAGAGDRLLSLIRYGSAAPGRIGPRVRGVDLDATMVRLGTMSLTFHGVEAPDLYTRNVLADPPDSAEGFDAILCQPPFGNRIDPSMLAEELRDLPNTRSEALFAELTLKLLKPGGRAAIVLPRSVTHSTAAAPLRRRMLERLRAVIALPQGTFQPHTNVETFIVALGPSTSHVVFIDARDAERGQTEQSMELLRRSGAIVGDLLDEDPRVEQQLPVEDRGRVFMVSKDEIRNRDFSLQASTYRPLHERSRTTDGPLPLLREIQQAEEEIMRRLDDLGQRLTERLSGNG